MTRKEALAYIRSELNGLPVHEDFEEQILRVVERIMVPMPIGIIEYKNKEQLEVITEVFKSFTWEKEDE